MAEAGGVLARFGHLSGIEVEVRQGDIFDIGTDLLIIGRSPAIRRQIETLSGEAFSDLFVTQLGRRKVVRLQSSKLRWPEVMALDYRPRCVRTTDRGWQPKYSHTLKLCYDLKSMIHNAVQRLKPSSIAILPLSWRNPEVVALATAGAIWSYGYWLPTTSLRQGEQEWDDPVLNMMESLFQPPEGMQAAKESALKHILSSGKVCMPLFSLVDLNDPSPWLRALQNTDGCLTQALDPEAHKSSWRRAPFSEIA